MEYLEACQYLNVFVFGPAHFETDTLVHCDGGESMRYPWYWFLVGFFCSFTSGTKIHNLHIPT